ncbi:MAG TPA: Uma2 family endonuclease [Allosphingosinicella sp.]|jgi:Uma2 family endonuclease|uniref:Uma2 family endonuclease n=1 Tax=Allosphingosinicella sp. TaxID=2823234 RepID=UPI002F26F8D8
MATDPFETKITADEFLLMDFGDKKVELVDGVIRAMTGGKRAHFRIQRNLVRYLGQALRRSGCGVYAEFGLRLSDATVRYPDVAVECGRPDDLEHDDDLVLQRPAVLFEVLSPSTKDRDQTTKLQLYAEIESVETIVFVDPDAETVRIVQRLGPTSWRNELFPQATDVFLPSLGVTIPKEEIFARD